MTGVQTCALPICAYLALPSVYGILPQLFKGDRTAQTAMQHQHASKLEEYSILAESLFAHQNLLPSQVAQPNAQAGLHELI